MTLEGFLIRCPEFGDTDLQLVASCLNGAAKEIDPITVGGMYDEMHAMLTAHKLACSPMGQNARLVTLGAPGGTTTYLTHYNELVKKCPLGVGIA